MMTPRSRNATEPTPPGAGEDAPATPESAPAPDRALMDAANLWLIRRQEGRADEDALAAWLAASPDHAEAWRRATLVYGALGGAAAAVVERRRAVTRRQVGGALAGLAVAAWLGRDLPLALTATVTAAGQTRDLTLPDGSHAVLNTASALGVDYGGAERRVDLKRGEAWFDVRHDPGRPFLVQAGDAQVRVLGTAFNVRRLAGGGIEVGVARGRVEVRRPGARTILAAGRQVVASSDGLVESAVEPSRVALWRSGWVALEQTRFGEAIDDLARYHRGPVLVLGEALRRRPFSGRFDIRDPERALALAVQAAPARMIALPGGARLIF